MLSSFAGVRFIRSAQPVQRLFRFNPGSKHVSMQLSRSLSGLTDLLFNRRNGDVADGKCKRLRPGKISPLRPVPDHILRPPYIGSRQPPGIASGPEVHDEKGIECMKASGKLAAQVLEFAGTLVKPGIRTDEIDQAVHQMIIDNGAYPSPLGYGGFPKSVCTSVNECICHGIPDSRELEDGDIINIDVTVYLDGHHGDTSATFFCGEVDEEAKTLVQVTKNAYIKQYQYVHQEWSSRKLEEQSMTMQINIVMVLSTNLLAMGLDVCSMQILLFYTSGTMKGGDGIKPDIHHRADVDNW
ncbi:hypothetical protein NL676_014335 [Syzygium grande]|nr:hypothetical protein NL676_014335 [Syzygium grande]